MYLLEFVTRRGDPVTIWKAGEWEPEKENVLIMQALSAALDRPAAALRHRHIYGQ